jgi:lysozyme
MKASKQCLEMLAHHEGVRTKPYRCPAGLWTVGVGHLIGDGLTLPDSWNRTFSLEEVYAILATDVRKFELGVAKYINVELTQNQFDAIVSFAFNLGNGCLQRSTIRSKLNRGDVSGCLKSWAKYNKAGGKVLKGLTLRRDAEINLFLAK